MRKNRSNDLEPHFQTWATKSRCLEDTKTAVALPRCSETTRGSIAGWWTFELKVRLELWQNYGVVHKKNRGGGDSRCQLRRRFGKKKKKKKRGQPVVWHILSECWKKKPVGAFEWFWMCRRHRPGFWFFQDYVVCTCTQLCQGQWLQFFSPDWQKRWHYSQPIDYPIRGWPSSSLLAAVHVRPY